MVKLSKVLSVASEAEETLVCTALVWKSEQTRFLVGLHLSGASKWRIGC